MTNPVRGFIDITAAVTAVVGSTVLWFAGVNTLSQRVALVTFGLGLVGLYTVSALYHSIPWRERWKQRMQRVDHSMIYVLVAASYTPIAVIVLDGWLRAATLVVIWGIAIVGVAHKVFADPRKRHALSVALQTTQGWLAVLILVPLARRLPFAAVELLLFGGVLYTVGMVFLVTGRPRLWPRVFSHHEMMHVMIVAGSVCHYLVTLRFIVPLAA
jgi:hemolysin III